MSPEQTADGGSRPRIRWIRLIVALGVAATMLTASSTAAAQTPVIDPRIPGLFPPPPPPLPADPYSEVFNVFRTQGTTVLASGLPCSLGSGPEKAVDGAASNIYTDKWCERSGIFGVDPCFFVGGACRWNGTNTGVARILITPGRAVCGYVIKKLVIKHAGAAGENPAYNTRAFKFRRWSSAYGGWIPGYETVTNNTANVTVLEGTWARTDTFELTIDIPTQGTSPVTRIYEVEAWGSLNRVTSSVFGGISCQ
jgi:hypothetical protein